MARVSLNPYEEKRPEDALDEQAGGIAPVTADGGTSGGAAPAKRAHFNDLSRLFYANEGQGKKVAQSAIQRAEGLAGKAQNQLTSAQQAYQAQAAAGTPKTFTPAANIAPTVQSPRLPGLIQNSQLLPTSTEALIRSTQSTAGRPTTQSNFNSAPNMADAEAAAGATYKGPNSLGETQGVDLAGIQQAFNTAGQAYNTLSRSPSGQTGGIGRFNDALAGAESRAALTSAQRRFQDLRNSLGQAVGNTAPADAARAAAAQNAQSAQSYLDQQHSEEARALAAQTQAQNAADVAKREDDSALQAWLNMPAIAGGGNVPGGARWFGAGSPTEFFNQNKDKIKAMLRERGLLPQVNAQTPFRPPSVRTS